MTKIAGIEENPTIEQCLNWVHQQFLQSDLFYGHGSDNPWDEAVFLVMSALELPIEGDVEVLQNKIPAEKLQQIKIWLKQRINKRQPLPYITGTSYFCGLPFKVDSRVLIPRSPIAELIEHGFSPWLQQRPDHILDLCTGSGCIAIACAYAFPEANVDATDLSGPALEIALENVEQHDLQQRLRLFQGDLFSALPADAPKYDLIVSNPPYVDAEDMSDLPEEFKLEPELALAAGDDGLSLVKIMLKKASQYLTDNGIFVVEVGNSAAALEKYYPKVPFTWIDFEHGGDGVFVLDKLQLEKYFS